MTDSEQPLAASLARLDAALDEVITAVGEAELSRLNAAGLIEFLHAVEQVRNAHATTPRTAVCGTPINPVRARLAAAITTGAITPEQSTVIVRALRGLDRLTDIAPADLDEAEHILIDHCAAFGPADLAIVARRITDHLFPDGTLGREAVDTDRRYLTLTHQPDGSATINGRLTAVAYN